MWAAWVSYPAYRAKNGRVKTMEDRIRDCFLYSMNSPASPSGKPPPGKPPPPGDDIYRDLESYFAWLAAGAKMGKPLAVRGYVKLSVTTLGYDPTRWLSGFRGPVRLLSWYRWTGTCQQRW